MCNPVVRMYVDENGHESLSGDLTNNNRRFLCLTGIIMPISEHDSVLTPAFDDLKVHYFGSKDIVLHRREIISAEAPFECLANQDTRDSFNADLLRIIRETLYQVISVVIDKYKLVSRYGLVFSKDPYALALEYLMQRYQYWLQEYARYDDGGKGDMLAEARGKREDRKTQETYQDIFVGHGYNPLERCEDYFSSSKMKLSPKKANIAGLQFVDIISHAARRYILMQNDLGNDYKTSSFEQDIVNILVTTKFRRFGQDIEGYGTVLYPK